MRVFLLNEDEGIAEHLREADAVAFTTAVPSGAFQGRAALTFLSFGEDLELLGRAEKTGRVATQKDRVSCSRLVEIKPPLALSEVRDAVPRQVAPYVVYGTLPEGTSSRFVEAVVRLRPELRAEIEAISATEDDTSWRAEPFQITAMEKDALGLALDFVDLDRTPLTRWRGSADEPRPFLEDLEGAVLREDQILGHDVGVFEEWTAVRESAVGSVRFERGNASLTAVNVNRTALERSLGVDLIYYHELFHAFVLVQYKRMKHEPRSGWGYRPDANHEAELERMRQIPAEPAIPSDVLSYRLNPGACFFKMCESTDFDPYSKLLIPGMYLPLEYLEASADAAQGPLGGAVFGYSTMPRHLNTTQFVQLVQDGWVGSADEVSDALREYVPARLRDGRSLVLAVGRRTSRRRVRR